MESKISVGYLTYSSLFVILPFQHPFCRNFAENALVSAFRHSFGHDFLKSVTVCCRENKFGCVLFKNLCERKGLATAEAQMGPLKAPCSASCCSRWLGYKAGGGAMVLLTRVVFTQPRKNAF